MSIILHIWNDGILHQLSYVCSQMWIGWSWLPRSWSQAGPHFRVSRLCLRPFPHWSIFRDWCDDMVDLEDLVALEFQFSLLVEMAQLRS